VYYYYYTATVGASKVFTRGVSTYTPDAASPGVAFHFRRASARKRRIFFFFNGGGGHSGSGRGTGLRRLNFILIRLVVDV